MVSASLLKYPCLMLQKAVKHDALDEKDQLAIQGLLRDQKDKFVFG